MKDVDTLVLNAGLALSTKDTAAQRTKQGFELTIGTNHLGHMALYELLEKRLAAAKGGVCDGDFREILTGKLKRNRYRHAW